MRKILALFVLLIVLCSNVYAYSIKVYDENGSRIGTYRKEGDNYVLYDFNDKKIENPSTLIQNAPSQNNLKEYSQYLYNENMYPIGTYRDGYFGPNRIHYGYGYNGGIYRRHLNGIRRNRANSEPRSTVYEDSRFTQFHDFSNNTKKYGGTVYEDSRFTKFHKF